MVNFKEFYHFSRFQRGSNIFQGGGGSNCSFPIETHVTCDFQGGPDPLSPPLDPLEQRAMPDICIEIGTNPPSYFGLSYAGNEEWVLVHWQVVLQLLARVQPQIQPRIQPLARLQPLRDLYCLTLEEALLTHSPLAIDIHCHIDRIRTDFRLARSASIPKPAREIQEICAHVPPDDHVVSQEGVVASFFDTVTRLAKCRQISILFAMAVAFTGKYWQIMGNTDKYALQP